MWGRGPDVYFLTIYVFDLLRPIPPFYHGGLMSRSSKLAEIRSYVSGLMTTSPTMKAFGTNFAVLGHTDGDACLFNGLLSAVSVPMGAMGVLSSQAQAGEAKPGMFYRSPRRRECDNHGFGAYFSRDMALGVLCAYSKPNQSKALRNEFMMSKGKWLHWIDHNRACLAKKPKWLGGGCLIRGPYRYAPDDRSLITPAMWAMMGRVWDFQGWPRHAQMKKWDKADGDMSIAQVENSELGYQVHLAAVQAYIKFLIDQSREYSMRVGQIAHERLPENLFYEFLAKRTITDGMIDRYLEMKPPFDQKWGSSWLWEKSEVTGERIAKSCGWDFVFMGKLILRYA